MVIDGNTPLNKALMELGITSKELLVYVPIIIAERNSSKIEKRLGNNILLDTAIQSYLAKINNPNAKQSTIKTRADILNRLKDFMNFEFANRNDSKVVCNVTEADIRTFLNLGNPKRKSKGKLSPFTYNKNKSIIQKFFDDLVLNGYLEKSPTKYITSVKQNDLPLMYLTKDEQLKILVNALKTSKQAGLRNHVIIYTGLNSGLRLEEMCDLNVGDLNFEEGYLLVRNGKGGKSRTVHLNKDTIETLLKYLKYYDINPNLKDNPLFISFKGKTKNERITREGMSKLVTRIFRSTGIKDGSMHRLRHSYAVNSLELGIDLISIQNQLGHEHLTTTFEYLRLDDKQILKKLKNDFPLAYISATNIIDIIENYNNPEEMMQFLKRLGVEKNERNEKNI
jgi:site-specific recombinase XerD